MFSSQELGRLTLLKKHIAEQANKALFSLLRKIRNLSLPLDGQIDLFNKAIKPFLPYGSEVWGNGNSDIFERVHLKFLKVILNNKDQCLFYEICRIGYYSNNS